MAVKRFALSDVDPVAITLCKQGANRQRFFLRKSAEGEAGRVELPGHRRLLKQAEGDDWSVVYCVVAEPGSAEDPGQVGEPGTEDVWASPDEIRKAAHRLLKNKAYVNLMHDALAEEGCAIVENAVALGDIEIEQPGGDTAIIRKGSWYVAIEPNDEAKAKIEAGEIEAISMEGTGLRTELEKAADFGEVIGSRELRDSLWQATSTLEDVIYSALRDEEETDPKAVIRRSLDQFVEFLAPKLDAIGNGGRQELAKRLATLGDTTTGTSQEEDVGLTEDMAALKKSTEESLEGIRGDVKKSTDATTAAVTGLVELTGKLVERVESLSGAAGAKDDDPDEKPSLKKAIKALGEIADRQDETDKAMTSIAKSLRSLSAGSSSQDDEDEDRTAVRKSEDDADAFARELLA